MCNNMCADDLYLSDYCYEKVFQVANEKLKSVDNWRKVNKVSLILIQLTAFCSALRKVSFLCGILSDCEKILIESPL